MGRVCFRVLISRNHLRPFGFETVSGFDFSVGPKR